MDKKTPPWAHGPHKRKECSASPTGKHCYCESSTAHTDFETTRTEKCCWCGRENVERIAATTVTSWSATDIGKHGPHKIDRTPRLWT